MLKIAVLVTAVTREDEKSEKEAAVGEECGACSGSSG